MMDKKGMTKSLSVEKWVYVIIIFVVLFLVVAALMPALQTALTNLSGGNYFGPLSSLFSSTGIVVIILGAALIIVVLRSLLGKHK